MVLSDPAEAMTSHTHAVRPRPGTPDAAMVAINGTTLRVNHYLHMFGERYVSFIHAERQNYTEEDRSMLAWLTEW